MIDLRRTSSSCPDCRLTSSGVG